MSLTRHFSVLDSHSRKQPSFDKTTQGASFWVSQNLKFSDKSAPISYRRDIIVRSLAFSRPPYHVCNVGAWRHGSRDHFYFHKISCIWWPRLADFTMQQWRAPVRLRSAAHVGPMEDGDDAVGRLLREFELLVPSRLACVWVRVFFL